jgi:hypothetical protein
VVVDVVLFKYCNLAAILKATKFGFCSLQLNDYVGNVLTDRQFALYLIIFFVVASKHLALMYWCLMLWDINLVYWCNSASCIN